MLKHLCPCCGRHCYLDEPQCERGIIYRETGEVPPRKPKVGANGEIAYRMIRADLEAEYGKEKHSASGIWRHRNGNDFV